MEGFRGAPRFLAYPRAFTVRSGTNALLSCQITGDPRPSILWEKDKIPIEPSGRFHVEAKGDLYSLLVSCATPQDSGLYVCKAKNSVGETYAAATLKVEAGEPQEEEGCSGSEAPAFLVAPSSMRVCRGEDVMFACRVSGQPCPVLEWEKDGHKLSDLFESSHFAVGQEPEDWHFLKLFGARPPDAGVYLCRARSGSQEALAAAVLLVEPRAPPDGLPDGSPADGPELLAEQQQQRRRRHAAGRRVGPETWVPNGAVPAGAPRAKAFAVSVGKHAKFRCYVTGKPKPEIIWQKDGEPLAPGRRHLVYEDREGYFILKVLYCKPQDQGLYVCTASNTAGQTLSAVQLRVKGRSVPKHCQGQPGAGGVQGLSSGRDASVREPSIPGLPPTLCSWGHPRLLRTELRAGNRGCWAALGSCVPLRAPLSLQTERWCLWRAASVQPRTGTGDSALVTNSPGSAEWFWRAALQGTAPSVCAGSSPVSQSRPASWGQPAAGATQHLVHPLPAPCCSPPLRCLLRRAGVHTPVSPKTPCWDAGGIADSPQPVPWFPPLWGMCFPGQCPSHAG